MDGCRNCCVMVETRIIPNLFEIIQEGHLKFIPISWGLTLFLSKENKHLIKPEMFGERIVEIIVLPFDNFSVDDYNNLLTCQSFWECIEAEKIFIFQSDSLVLRMGIEDFLDVDYIGACWDFPPFVGNGGFSLRTKKYMLDIINKVPYDYSKHGNEDVYFCNLLESVGGKLATIEQAMLFSVEKILGYGSFGIHAIEKYHKKEQCDSILNQYNV